MGWEYFWENLKEKYPKFMNRLIKFFKIFFIIFSIFFFFFCLYFIYFLTWNTEDYTQYIADHFDNVFLIILHVLIFSRSRSYFFRFIHFIEDFDIIMGLEFLRVYKILFDIWKKYIKKK